ncbi:MAG: PspC domain-containing protein [Bacteroidales bacterium]|nr:PspC domain-containing protein [Bacteroidales bacterium]
METQTIKANINGKLFEFETDAYNRLEEYLYSMRRNLNLSPNEADETMQDIEARIAEHLSERVSEGNSVIKLEHVIRIITIIGEPEQIEDEAETKSSESNYSSSKSGDYKRIYRNPDRRVLGGACSGLADYFNIDVIWIRLFFVVITFIFAGIPILFYLLLWAIIPEGETTFQKKSSNGSTFEDLKDNVNRELQKTAHSLKKYKETDGYKNTRRSMDDFFSQFGRTLGILLKVAVVVVAILLVIKGVFWITGVGFMHFPPFHFDGFHGFHEFHGVNAPMGIAAILAIMAVFIVLIPLILFFVFLVRAIFGQRTNRSTGSWMFGIVWILLIAGFFTLLFSTDFGISAKQETVNTYKFEQLPDEKLRIELHEEEDDNYIHYYSVFNYEFAWNDRRDHFMEHPEVHIQSTDGDLIKVKVVKRFYAFEDKSRYANRLYKDFNWHMEGNVLRIDEFYEYDEDEFWLRPELDIYVYIPDSQDYMVDEDLEVLMDEQ